MEAKRQSKLSIISKSTFLRNTFAQALLESHKVNLYKK